MVDHLNPLVIHQPLPAGGSMAPADLNQQDSVDLHLSEIQELLPAGWEPAVVMGKCGERVGML